ncbi:MAG TPA: FkbM family methyltransferase, partial [Bacteroidia bacterium]|nr:FkbM family methyltransferase [Bacteroidia bacterium]
MKEFIIKILHGLFGYERYLRMFSAFKIKTLRLDKRKSAFLYFTSLHGAHANIVVAGACTGITTVPFVRKYPGRTVFAYEPVKSNFNVLNDVIRKFGLSNVKTFHLGLGNRREEREFVLPLVNGVKKQGLAHIRDASIEGYEDGVTETVTVDRLDNRSELQSIRIDGIKIVAENFELPIFEGARSIIEKNKPVIYCELWENEN